MAYLFPDNRAASTLTKKNISNRPSLSLSCRVKGSLKFETGKKRNRIKYNEENGGEAFFS